jgi:hypothetical protein
MDRRGATTLGVTAALLALGAALRLRPYAACPSYWYDEAYLLLNVRDASFLGLLGPLRDDQAAPPLFLWALRGLYLLAGGSEWCMRLPALAAAAAGLFAMVPLARRAVGRRAAVWAVAFCALAHHAAAHAAEVKPYALDFLLTQLVLLAALRCRPAGRGRAALAVLAVLGPWASYPSVFVLGGAGLALWARALRRPRRLLFPAVWSALFGASVFVLWLTAARFQANAGLRAFWAGSFLDLSSPDAAVAWVGRCLVEVGNYGTREMGGPLLLLALAGAASLRRAPRRVLLLAGPLLLALAASALRVYPLGGRLLFFLTPCVWLLAARGAGALVRRAPARCRGWAAALPAVLLLPAALWASRLLVVVTPRCQFREAFAHVAARRGPNDVLWVSHPQVYEVYHGAPPDLGAYSRPDAVGRAARAGRLWVVCTVAGARRQLTAGDAVARVRAAGGVAVHRRRFRGLDVVLYAPGR